jgi:DNA end-binding protein Ku
MADRYEARLREVIAAKLKGQGVKAAPAPKDDGKVVDLMAALKRSLGQSAEKPKAAAGKKAARS